MAAERNKPNKQHLTIALSPEYLDLIEAIAWSQRRTRGETARLVFQDALDIVSKDIPDLDEALEAVRSRKS
jgi:predicted transcriptional regulator